MDNQNNMYTPVKEEVNIGFGFLSFFIPIVGIILFFVWKDQKERAFNRLLLPALIAIGLQVLYYIFFFVIFAAAATV